MSDQSYESMSQAPLGDNILAQIAATARDIMSARDDVSRAEEALKGAQARLRSLEEDTLPELMAEAGQERLTTIDGLDVKVTDRVRGTPSKENAPQAFKWLRDGGNGGIIKHELKADLGKGDDALVKAVLEALQALNVRASAKESVNHQTLGALVREKLAKGEELPLELLGIQLSKVAEVKPRK